LRVERPNSVGEGEVCARAEHLFHTDPDGWLRTGDIGTIDSDGYLRLVGRKGDLISRGGENVYPVEVEHVLAEHENVVEAAVVGMPDERLGQSVRAFVVLSDPSNPPGPEDLRSFARERLAGFKVPASWVFVDALPHSAVGKLLRRELLAPDPGGQQSPALPPNI
jgi:acyl-CoA synthetase (AMP-forming)/AMP-acid ligase II